MAFEDVPVEEMISALAAPDAPTLNYDVLTPAEFAELSWRASEGIDPLDVYGHHNFDLSISAYLASLAEVNPDRLRAIVESIGDRPAVEDRRRIAEMDAGGYIGLHYDTGLMLLDRLIRDVDPTVREAALSALGSIVLNAIPEGVHRTLPYDIRRRPDGVTAVDLLTHVDPDLLRERANGMTIDEVNDLYEAAAYAENGQYLHDIGRRALIKLLAASKGGVAHGAATPPDSHWESSPASGARGT